MIVLSTVNVVDANDDKVAGSVDTIGFTYTAGTKESKGPVERAHGFAVILFLRLLPNETLSSREKREKTSYIINSSPGPTRSTGTSTSNFFGLASSKSRR